MEFRLLGPMEVLAEGRLLDAGPPQQRLVLVVLAAEVGRPVRAETLIDRVWEDPPDRVRPTLYVHISRIRRLLATPTASDQPPVSLVRRAGGYLLDLEPERVDVHQFQRLIGQARHHGWPEARRVALLGQALELWRGPPLPDLPGQWAARVRQRWKQQYIEAVMAWALACLRVGDSGAVLPRLNELVEEHPLMESLAAVYMRALYAAGRPADALHHYTAIRRRLADELGTDPGPPLQQLHRQILTCDPVLTTPSGSSTPAPSPPVPRQLPTPPRLFTGRTGELATLQAVHDPSEVVITAIDGMAGIGKTALAVHAAHRIADRYPDGQLFIDLHGCTQGMEPIEPAEALDRMLRALGTPGTQLPTGLDEKAALYRSRLADTKTLIVLDNAAAESQVAPLLPGSAGCLVLVTSRSRLTGLDHTHILSLDTLPTSDAITLFTDTVGGGRLAGQQPEPLVELVELCGRLPLAIRIAAARLRSHPTWCLSHLVRRLRDQQHRLGELEAGQRSVTAALDLSYQHLNTDQRRAYRLLGLHPGPDIDPYATAALLDSHLRHAHRMLDGLLEAHLLQEPTPGRYRFHDLTRAHAAHTATRDQAEPTQDAALDRLLDHYQHATSAAIEAAYPYERERRPSIPRAPTPRPDLPEPAAALEWLDTELPNLLAAARYATEHGQPTHVRHLSTILHLHLRTRGRYHDAEALHQQALATARATGDQPGQLSALVGLGDIHRMQGRSAQAADHYRQALQVARTTGHRPAELNALVGLGHVHRMQGRSAQAAADFKQALQIARTTGHRPAEMNALTGLGGIHLLQGRPPKPPQTSGRRYRSPAPPATAPPR